jgi:L-aminopeptidase/D-esterase-like protein
VAVSRGPLQDVPGVRVGHVTSVTARTGLTVIRFDRPALTAVEVRGAAPGTRELDLLAPGRTVQRADAILLTGGSAFGLRAADGMMETLAEEGRGFPTSMGPVPIVPAAVIFDLDQGQPEAPAPADGRAALAAAVPLPRVEQGRIGAGTGATWGKVAGLARPGGVGMAQHHAGGFLVTALVVLNAFGVVRGMAADPRAEITTATRDIRPGEATTLVSVITDAPCDHGTLTRLCVAAHDGLARTIVPAHTLADGDVAFASTIASGAMSPGLSLPLSLACELAVEHAVLSAAHYAAEGVLH